MEILDDVIIYNGLMWQKEPYFKMRGLFNFKKKNYQQLNWEEALKYAHNLEFAGYDDWRLPTQMELRQLLNIPIYGEIDDYSKGYYNCYNQVWENWFENNKDKRFSNSNNHKFFMKKEFIETMPYFVRLWSSTTYKPKSSRAWLMSYVEGLECHNDKDDSYYHVLCVRELDLFS